MKIKNRVVRVAAVPLAAGALVIGGLAFAGTASADGPSGGASQPQPGAQMTQRPPQGRGTVATAQQFTAPAWLTSDLQAAAAQQIGISKAQLLQEMGRGSIAQVAARHGVSFSVIKTTLVNVGDADLQKATAAGTVSQNDANQIVSTIPQLMERFLNSGQGRGGPAGGPTFNGQPGGAFGGLRPNVAPMAR